MEIGFENLNIDDSIIDNWNDIVKSFKKPETGLESR